MAAVFCGGTSACTRKIPTTRPDSGRHQCQEPGTPDWGDRTTQRLHQLAHAPALRRTQYPDAPVPASIEGNTRFPRREGRCCGKFSAKSFFPSCDERVCRATTITASAFPCRDRNHDIVVRVRFPEGGQTVVDDLFGQVSIGAGPGRPGREEVLVAGYWRVCFRIPAARCAECRLAVCKIHHSAVEVEGPRSLASYRDGAVVGSVFQDIEYASELAGPRTAPSSIRVRCEGKVQFSQCPRVSTRISSEVQVALWAQPP